jgi:hypothetical protein
MVGGQNWISNLAVNVNATMKVVAMARGFFAKSKRTRNETGIVGMWCRPNGIVMDSGKGCPEIQYSMIRLIRWLEFVGTVVVAVRHAVSSKRSRGTHKGSVNAGDDEQTESHDLL